MRATSDYWYLWTCGDWYSLPKVCPLQGAAVFHSTLFAVKDGTAYESAPRGIPSIPAHGRSPVERFKGKQVHTTTIKSTHSHIPVNNWAGKGPYISVSVIYMTVRRDMHRATIHTRLRARHLKPSVIRRLSTVLSTSVTTNLLALIMNDPFGEVVRLLRYELMYTVARVLF